MERLYSILEIMKIKDIVRFHSETTTPIPDVVYHLYSLPSFDNNQTREELLGQDIQSNKFTVPNRCILFNKLNVRFKRIWRIDSDEDHKIASTEFLPLIIDENKVDFDYCFYLLASPAITDYLCGQNANTSGSHKRIDPTNFFNIGIKLPPLAQQYEIGKLLSSLDTKIKLNRQINQNLEAMAKQLYDYWFVQFDFPNEEGKPYKSSGGEMVWNKKLKREIPKGWNISLIKDIATTYSGGTPQSTNIEYYNNGEIAWINSGELNSPIITKTTNYITKCGLENSSAKLYPSNSILVAMYGATAGKVSLLTFEACSNQAVCGIIPTIENMLYYVYFHISSLYSHFITLSTGSARDNISQNTIKNILLPIPTRNILKLFDEKIGSIYQMIVNNYQQIDSLTKQRDELLPLLMNGQVSVNSDLSVYKKRRGKVPLLDSKRCVRHLSPSSAIHNCFGQRILDR